MTTASTARPAKQLLHLVFGGELKTLADVEFKDLDRLDIVGIYPSYAEVSELRGGLQSLAGGGSAHGRQRRYPLLYRAYPPLARSDASIA